MLTWALVVLLINFEPESIPTIIFIISMMFDVGIVCAISNIWWKR